MDSTCLIDWSKSVLYCTNERYGNMEEGPLNENGQEAVHEVYLNSSTNFFSWTEELGNFLHEGNKI